MSARAQIIGHTTYHNSIRMPSLMLPKLLPAAETRWTDVHPIPNLADRVGTFYPDRMSKIAGTSVTLNLKTRFVHGWGVDLRKEPRENQWVVMYDDIAGGRRHTLNLFRLMLPLAMRHSHILQVHSEFPKAGCLIWGHERAGWRKVAETRSLRFGCYRCLGVLVIHVWK